MSTAILSASLALSLSNAYELETPVRIITEDGLYGKIEGFASHGVNSFNGLPIVDLVDSLGFGAIFDQPTYEQHCLNTEGDEEILPTATTDRSLPLATGRFFTERMNSMGFDITPVDGIFNTPIMEIGTITAYSTNIDDRSTLKTFDEAVGTTSSDNFPVTYYPHGALLMPTLGDWEKASGLVEISCDAYDGTAVIEATVCNALPSQLYSIWEVGLLNPGQDSEGMYYEPAGGVGDVIRTDFTGYGQLRFKMPWCPIKECVSGESKFCPVYFSVTHHPDYLIWGAEPAGLQWKPNSWPGGVSAANHLWFPIIGEFLQDPVVRYDAATCKNGDDPLMEKLRRRSRR